MDVADIAALALELLQLLRLLQKSERRPRFCFVFASHAQHRRMTKCSARVVIF